MTIQKIEEIISKRFTNIKDKSNGILCFENISNLLRSKSSEFIISKNSIKNIKMFPFIAKLYYFGSFQSNTREIKSLSLLSSKSNHFAFYLINRFTLPRKLKLLNEKIRNLLAKKSRLF